MNLVTFLQNETSVFILTIILKNNPNYFHQLVYPTVMDPAGIFMLKSVYGIFDSVGINIQVEMKSITDGEKIIDAINKGIHPVVLAVNRQNENLAHAMVATDVKKRNIGDKIEYFLECKNSYRDVRYQPGIFHHHSHISRIIIDFVLHQIREFYGRNHTRYSRNSINMWSLKTNTWLAAWKIYSRVLCFAK